MRKLGIDYGEAKVGIAITDPLNITVQGLKTIVHKGRDKFLLKEIDKILEEYEVDTFVVGNPINMDGTIGIRAERTAQFINKLKCKYNNMKIEAVDERLTTVSAFKTMNFLEIKRERQKDIVDTLSAQYILEIYMQKLLQKNNN